MEIIGPSRSHRWHQALLPPRQAGWYPGVQVIGVECQYSTQDVGALFASGSVANCLPTRCLRGPKSGNHEAHTSSRRLGPSSPQSRHDALSLYFFGTRRKHLAGKHFATDADVKQAVTYWLPTLDTDFLHTGIQVLMSWWDKCINFRGDYVEVCLPMCHVYVEAAWSRREGVFTLLSKLLCVLTYLLISFQRTNMLNRNITALGDTCSMSKR